MSSVVIKLGSLVIKTLSKPIANKIKEQARNHERFRRVCVQTAQAIHRWDMRFKLGLLQDSATQEKQAKREAAEAQAAKHKHETPTVKTEAQTLADESKAAKEKEEDRGGEKKAKEPAKPKVKIRPLSEAKAIDSGANFVSETFLLLVGVALILGENWRQNRKQKSRREDVAERIGELEEYEKSARKGLLGLEKEVLRLRKEVDTKNGAKTSTQARILPPEVYRLEEKEAEEERKLPREESWWAWITRNSSRNQTAEDANTVTETTPKTTTTVENVTTTPPQPETPSIFRKILPSPKEENISHHPSEPPSNIHTKGIIDTVAPKK